MSTGKEANVYHAVSYDGEKEYAIKIYKTSILIFKDREKYIEGEVSYYKIFYNISFINYSFDLDMVIVKVIQEN